MSDAILTCADLRAILAAMGHDLEGRLDELRELDAALGDGDLGVTMQLAVGAIVDMAREAVAETEDPREEEADDIGTMLARLGMSINKVSPSTFGTLLASAFVGAGAAVRGTATVGVKDLAAMGSAAIEAIKRRGKAEVGDKTMLDSLVPAVEAFNGVLATDIGDRSAVNALAAAVEASERGMEATRGMVAKHGRASWRREESMGSLDAGATATHYMIRSFAQHAADHLS